MNMKKLAVAMLGSVLAAGLLVGCGGGADKPQAQQDKPAEVKIGMLTHLNASEEKINEIMKKIDEETSVNSSVKLSRNYVYYDKLTSMQMGLDSGSIQEMSLYSSVSKYLSDRNDTLMPAELQGPKLSDSFCCALRKDDSELKAELDKVIGEMKQDGTLEKLTKEYITDLEKGQEPPAVPIPKTEGAPVLKIAVTGDLPPLDLVRADGTAAGFNTAVLSELAKRLGRNVEIIQIDSAARASALVSKKVDVVFWAVVPAEGSKMPADIDKPSGVELTESYYTDQIVHLKKK